MRVRPERRRRTEFDLFQPGWRGGTRGTPRRSRALRGWTKRCFFLFGSPSLGSDLSYPVGGLRHFRSSDSRWRPPRSPDSQGVGRGRATTEPELLIRRGATRARTRRPGDGGSAAHGEPGPVRQLHGGGQRGWPDGLPRRRSPNPYSAAGQGNGRTAAVYAPPRRHRWPASDYRRVLDIGGTERPAPPLLRPGSTPQPPRQAATCCWSCHASSS